MKAALQNKLYIHDSLKAVFLGHTKEMTTTCILRQLTKNEDKEGARFVAKRMEHRRCRHDKLKESFACILELIGKTNKHRYAVATQDSLLREKLRKVPGVPMVFIKSGMVISEPPSLATLDAWKKTETDKTLPSKEEMENLDKAFGISVDASSSDKVEEKKKLKKKKTSGVNPLSCLKKKVEIRPVSEGIKKKRTRKGKKSPE